MATKLTKKQEKFVAELAKGKSQREAYKLAYNCKNMTDATIDSNACRLLKNSKVAEKYTKLRSKVEAEAEKQQVMAVLDVIKEIEKIAKGDISDYLNFRTEKTLVGHDKETGEPIFDYAPIIEVKDSQTIDTGNIQEVSISSNGTFKFKMYSREAALYRLLDLYGITSIEKAKLKLSQDRLDMDKDINGKKYWQ